MICFPLQKFQNIQYPSRNLDSSQPVLESNLSFSKDLHRATLIKEIGIMLANVLDPNI